LYFQEFNDVEITDLQPFVGLSLNGLGEELLVPTLQFPTEAMLGAGH